MITSKVGRTVSHKQGRDLRMHTNTPMKSGDLRCLDYCQDKNNGIEYKRRRPWDFERYVKVPFGRSSRGMLGELTYGCPWYEAEQDGENPE